MALPLSAVLKLSLSPVLKRPLSAAGRGGRCPRCCSRRRRGRGGSSSLSPRRSWGRAARQSRGFASRRKNLLPGRHVGRVVLPVFPPPLPTPLSSSRCGFEVGFRFFGFFSARPLLDRSWASAPAPSQGLPQSRRGERAFLERAGLPAGCPAGRGAPSGSLPLTRRTPASSGCAAPPLGVVSAASPRPPCPGWDRFLPSLRGWPMRGVYVWVAGCERRGGGGELNQHAK